MISELKKWIYRNFFMNSAADREEERIQRRELFRNMRREERVDQGNFVYYILEQGTNIRRSEGGIPIIYRTKDIADYECNWAHEAVISVATYNRMYGRFMVTDGYWHRTYWGE